MTGQNPKALDATRWEFPHVHTFRSDVSKPEDIAALGKEVAARFPHLNMLINNAGQMRLIDVQDDSLDLENVTRGAMLPPAAPVPRRLWLRRKR